MINNLLSFSEYLATFKKTVAMHEVFLTRLAAHPTLRKDSNFNVFLEFKGEVCTFHCVALSTGQKISLRKT